MSCFQYILVAAVFSIGPPYRKPMWTNNLLMLSLIVLSSFNVLVLLAPPALFSAILELMPIPSSARFTLLGAVIINVALSLAFERWGAQGVANLVDMYLHTRKRRIRDGKAYKAIDSGTR